MKTLTRHHRLIRSALNETLDRAKPYALFDFPGYPNVGDSAIWLGQAHVLLDFFGRQPVCTEEAFAIAKPLPRLSPSVQILLNGGGSLGDLWPIHQAFRERVLREYSENKVVQLPQSIHFKSDTNFDRCKTVFSTHKNFVLMVRDESSFRIGSLLHAGQTLLVPDMALALNCLRRLVRPSVPIVGLLRSDQERKIADNFSVLSKIEVIDWTEDPCERENRLLRRLEGLPVDHPLGLWLAQRLKRRIHHRIARRRVKHGCKILSRGQVVITDRLHAHILCTLMNIPHVVIDNSYGKVFGFRNAWGIDLPGTCLEAEDLQSAHEKAITLLAQT